MLRHRINKRSQKQQLQLLSGYVERPKGVCIISYMMLDLYGELLMKLFRIFLMYVI